MKDTREYILRKSLELFLEKPYKDVTMREIVIRTGLSKGAFYHYFESKESVFEEVVKYFYNEIMITDYSDFPETSLQDFCDAYIKRLEQENNDMDYSGTNLFVFISEASRRIPSFMEIHNAQRKKEIDAWTGAVQKARKNKEIVSGLSDIQLAKMFIYLSDGVSLTTMTDKPNENTIRDLKENWNNLYSLIIKK